MSDIENGGPAFPGASLQMESMTYTNHEGMTLRDYFAAKVMPAVYSDYCESARTIGFDENWKMGVALDAYALADAMIEARKS